VTVTLTVDDLASSEEERLYLPVVQHKACETISAGAD
jgi:hypothetical protein